jgi:hypothetical protein
LIQQNRSSQPADCQVTHNNRVHHNVVISDFNNGLTGAVADYNAWGLFTGGNAFYSNYYHMPNLASSRFRYWNGVSGASAGDAYYNWNGWRNNPVNFDLQGGADTTLVPASSVTLPALTNITEVSVGQTTAVITWTSDNPADTQVEYGAGLSAVCAWPAYGSLTPLTDTAVNVAGHCVTLTALGSCTQYHYRVMSRDASGAARVSLDQTFTTGGCPPAPQGQSNGLQVVGMPNPQRGPLFTLGINLSAPADKLMVKLYTSAMLLAADVEVAGPFPRTGWRQISFYAAGLSNGVYFLKAGAESGGQVTEWKTGTLYILR